MASIPTATEDFDEAAIVARCLDHTTRSESGHHGIVNLSEEVLVKFGKVYPEEARNQQFAYHHLNSANIRVAKVIHYFQRQQNGRYIGYLVMERFKDFQRATIDDVLAVTTAVGHMTKLVNERPGPVDGGFLRHRFQDPIRFEDKTDLTNFLNSRRLSKGIPIDLTNEQLVFTHLDLATRNIGRQSHDDRSICILDWEMAGFYPRWFEIAMIEACPDADEQDNQFKDLLAEELKRDKPLSELEQEQMQTLKTVMTNCVSTYFTPWKGQLVTEFLFAASSSLEPIPQVDFNARHYQAGTLELSPLQLRIILDLEQESSLKTRRLDHDNDESDSESSDENDDGSTHDGSSDRGNGCRNDEHNPT